MQPIAIYVPCSHPVAFLVRIDAGQDSILRATIENNSEYHKCDKCRYHYHCPHDEPQRVLLGSHSAGVLHMAGEYATKSPRGSCEIKANRRVPRGPKWLAEAKGPPR